MSFEKGNKIIHEKYGKGTYSHKYAKDACIVEFDEQCPDGFKTRVVLFKEIKKEEE